MINVLMVGVDKSRLGGMWTVSENYIESKEYNKKINLTYVSTSCSGSVIKRIFKMLCGYFTILFVLLTKEIDLVHIHMAEKGSVYRKGIVIYISKFFRKKTLIHMHAGPIMGWYRLQSGFKKKVITKIFNKADKMLVLGKYWKNELKEIVLKEKIEVLYNGTYCPNKNLYNVSGEVILYLGMINKMKGVYDLVEAVKLIDQILDNKIKIYICGFDEGNKLKKYIKENIASDRFVLKGWINNNEKIEIFKNTLLCVLPSYFEGLSMTVIESMCYGIPVLTTNISTMPEVLGEEIEKINPGDILNLAETLLDLCKNEEKRINMSSIEYLRAKEKFAIELVMKKTNKIYKEILS